MFGYDPTFNHQIGGALPWNGGGNPAAAIGGSPAQIGQAYGQAYNSALAMNQSNYSNILAGYQKSLASQTSAQQAIQSGYSSLYNSVLDKVSQIGAARSKSINDASSQSLARGSQQLIDRGLGNTTITSSLSRGIEADRNNRQLELSESLAKMTGDYMSQLGLAGLSAQERGLDDTVGLGLRQLDWMNSVNAKYPDAGMYASLAQQSAAAQAGRGGAGGYEPGAVGGGSFAGPAPKLGYQPAGAPVYAQGAYGAQPGGGGGGSWMLNQYAASPYEAAATGGYGSAIGGVGASMTPYGGAISGIGGQMSSNWLERQVPDYGGGGDF